MRFKKICSITLLSQLVILLLIFPENAQCETLKASVQAKIVNVTSWDGYNAVRPSSYDPDLAIYNVKISNKNITWSSVPYPFPFPPLPPDGGVAYLHVVKSNDGGKTYQGQIVNTLYYRSSAPLSLNFPISPNGGWIGTMFSTICDHGPICNGRQRSNIYFVKY